MYHQPRVPDWRTRLTRWARKQDGRPFIWGATDCASLARQALEQMFGRDVIPEVPRYSSWEEAVRVAAALHSRGGMESVLRRLGGENVPREFLRGGDFIVRPEAEEDAGGQSILVCIDSPLCLVSTREYGVQWGVPTSGTVWSLWEVPVNG